MIGVRAVFVLGFVFLTACGGGGASSTPPSADPLPGASVATIVGQIQKGPFVVGADVRVSSVSIGGAVGARIVSTTTSDGLGSFRADVNVNQIILIEGQGRILNETTGTFTTTTLSLMAISDVSAASTQTANVNVLTHLAVPRIRSLLQGGASAVAAESQSRDEVLAAIAAIVAPPQIASFKGTTLYSPTQGDVDSAYLVMLSALFMERARELSDKFGTELTAELQMLLDSVAADLGDGVVDYPAALLAVGASAYHLDPAIVARSLADLATRQGSNQQAGDIFLFMDSDLDGVINIDDPDDDNDGVNDADDAYPLSWGCYLAAQGDGSACTIESSIPASYGSQSVDTDNNGIVYLLDSDNQQIVRWSISRQQYGFPVSVPFGARELEYSPIHDRVFVGFGTGEVLAIEPSGEHATTTFASIGISVNEISRAGNYLVVADAIGNWYSLAADGSVASQLSSKASLNYFAWSDANDRLYSLEWGGFAVDFEYVTVDQQTGAFGVAKSAPSESDDFFLRHRLHLSVDGSRIAAGSGDIFSADTLEWERSLAGLHYDAAWLADNTIATLAWSSTGATNETRLEHRDERGALIEFANYPGSPLRVIAYGHRLQVITLESRPVFHSFVPGGDEDGDGVANPVDAFASDPAASLDSDRDGYPDDWNPGKAESDSTTGLTRDVYPSDSACYLQHHGDGVTCNIGSAVSSFFPDETLVDANGVVYLLDISSKRIARWDSTNGHQNPLPFGGGDGSDLYLMRYSPEQHRLYLGYRSGKLTYFDLADPGKEHYFAATPTGLRDMQSAGNYVWTAGADGHGVGSHSVSFDAAGNAAGRAPNARYSRNRQDTVWNAALARIYLLAGNGIQADIYYQSVDQTTGQMGVVVDSPYNAKPKNVGPIRTSPDGSKVLLGSGDIYSAIDLTWMRAISPDFKDAQWSDDGDIVVIRLFSNGGAGTRVERINGSGNFAEFAVAGGVPIALHRDGGDFRFMTMFNGGLLFFRYRPSNDTDGDGVENTIDAFPLDPSASVDIDSDGHPGAWHTGMSAGDSTTGLTLDAYPNDSACTLPEHGDGTVCDIASAIPAYTPERIEIDTRGIVYLYSPLTRRIYRWDAVTRQHLNPYVIGRDKWLGDVFPVDMLYHPDHDRIYVSYGSQHVMYIDPGTDPEEHYFIVLGSSGIGLGHAGNFLLTVDEPVARATHKIFDVDGVLRYREESERSLEYSWDAALNRLYFFDGAQLQSDLRYETIDQTTGQIVGRGESYYLYSYEAKPPIRASVDGSRIVTGAGDLYENVLLNWTGSLGGNIADARWLADGSIVTLQASGGNTSYERRNGSDTVVETRQFAGVPLAILPFGSDFVVVTDQGSPTFLLHTPSDN